MQIIILGVGIIIGLLIPKATREMKNVKSVDEVLDAEEAQFFEPETAEERLDKIMRQ